MPAKKGTRPTYTVAVRLTRVDYAKLEKLKEALAARDLRGGVSSSEAIRYAIGVALVH